ncbi:Transcriptional regulatory protein DegU [Paenibacillus konkukensis]|uniref:Transcriptional regulatory protein DegU n=1 Tax=Paenibacillus konkukensis TaxID=2020716 RepID=A0ABY4RL92_9BACL|nr:response regulator [Paenibacillus konkukensis]UQZ82646.1 Transcriptional regulatory protein DegU [Paenibacillus konkukensis]
MGIQEAGEQRRIKMLIVDDEPIICMGLRCTIDWEELGVEVIGEAYDGEEALRLMEREQADFLLSDIRMDGMDGLELAEQLRQRYPDTQMIIISGYEDFGYARQAMRLGVNDYLLKPVEVDELTKVVQKLVEGIRSRGNASGDQDVKLWLANMARSGIAYGKMSPPPLHGVQFRILASQLACFQELYEDVRPDQYERIQEQWIHTLQRRLENPGLRPFSIFDHENLLITLAASDRVMDEREWDLLLRQNTMPSSEQPPFYCGVSEPYEHLEETAQRCAEAASRLKYYVLEHEPVLNAAYEAKWQEGRRPEALDVSARVQHLVAALFKQGEQEVKAEVADMFQLFKKEAYLLHEVVAVCEELFALLRQRLRKSGMTGLDGGRPSLDLHLYNSYHALEEAANRDMAELLALIEKNGIDRSYWIIEKAKSYINDQYRSDLKASEVAAWLKITPSYFSYIFKQSTGKGFTEYMNELRIEQAKSLLATTHDKVFEIADQVGYKEYKYFVSVFKSFTGLTPKEYRGLRASKTEKR